MAKPFSSGIYLVRMDDWPPAPLCGWLTEGRSGRLITRFEHPYPLEQRIRFMGFFFI
jgi:hypothetical protein